MLNYRIALPLLAAFLAAPASAGIIITQIDLESRANAAINGESFAPDIDHQRADRTDAGALSASTLATQSSSNVDNTRTASASYAMTSQIVETGTGNLQARHANRVETRSRVSGALSSAAFGNSQVAQNGHVASQCCAPRQYEHSFIAEKTDLLYVSTAYRQTAGADPDFNSDPLVIINRSGALQSLYRGRLGESGAIQVTAGQLVELYFEFYSAYTGNFDQYFAASAASVNFSFGEGYAGSSASNPLLGGPADGGGTNFLFNTGGAELVYIDPLASDTFDYVINAGPNATRLILPVGMDDNLFDLFLWDGIGWFDSGIDLTGGVEFAFAPGGVSRFRIGGIDAGFDSFTTGLGFAGAGVVDIDKIGSVQAQPVPEPAMAALIGFGALGIGLRRRRNR